MPEDSFILKEDVNVGGNEVCQLQLKQRKRMQKIRQFFVAEQKVELQLNRLTWKIRQSLMN